MTASIKFASSTFELVQQHDAFIAGYMHASCGHGDDEFRETYRNACVHVAWQNGYSAGTHYSGSVGWSADAVAKAREAYHDWRVTEGMAEVAAMDRDRRGMR